MWEGVEHTRNPDRLGVRHLLRYGAHGTLALNGTEEGEQDAAVLVTLTRLDGQPCAWWSNRTATSRPAPPRSERQRCGRRDGGCAWPRSWAFPLVTVIDTPGAELSVAAEEGAIAGEIARCIATLTTMTVPTVSVILGQGCGGGALALLPAQVVVATENAWLSPLPPEGASVIRYGDVDHAPEMAESQGIGSAALVESGIVQRVEYESCRTRRPTHSPEQSPPPSPTPWSAWRLPMVDGPPVVEERAEASVSKPPGRPWWLSRRVLRSHPVVEERAKRASRNHLR